MPKKISVEKILETFDNKHHSKYDYSLSVIKNTHSNIKIICSKHGIFEQRVSNHMKGNICPYCSGRLNNLSTFKEKSIKKHLHKYDYSLVNYINNTTKVKIICSKHGVFEQMPLVHLKGGGCPKCGGTKKLNTNDFILISKEIHGDKYDYSLAEYKTAKNKVKIVCPEHGIFEQIPDNHLRRKQGCPICKESKGEKEIRVLLESKKINFISQKRFEKCKNKLPLPFDFYLPDYNMCIEFDGKQHFKPVERWGGEEGLMIRKKKDKIKNNFCKENNIKLLRIKYNDNIKNKIEENENIQSFFK